MTTSLLNKAGKKLFEKHMEQYAPADPMYETYTDGHGKKRKRKRALPPGLSARDAKILQSVQKRAHYLDKGFRICGIRFGWTFLIGIVPMAGDITDAVLNYTLVVRKARKAEIPSWLLRQMLFNNVVSASVGLVPFVGDVILAIYKANSRNAALLEEFLRIRGEEYIKLRAEGKDPEKIAAEARAAKKKGKGKGKEKKDGSVEKTADTVKTEEVAEGVTKGDVGQVKPGAGRKSGEVLPGTGKPGGTDTVADQSSDAPQKTTKGRRLSFGPFGKRSSSTQGRFVENVGPSSATNGTK